MVFIGGPVVGNLPCDVVDVGSNPGLRTRIPQASGQLSNKISKCGHSRVCALQQEKPMPQ